MVGFNNIKSNHANYNHNNQHHYKANNNHDDNGGGHRRVTNMRSSTSHSNFTDKLIIDKFPQLSKHQNHIKRTPNVTPIGMQDDSYKTNTIKSPDRTKTFYNNSTILPNLPHSISLNQHLNNNCMATGSSRSVQQTNNGFILGTFLKVWTRLKRPILPGHRGKSSSLVINSNNQFEYISGDQLMTTGSNQHRSTQQGAMLLSDEDFRQNNKPNKQDDRLFKHHSTGDTKLINNKLGPDVSASNTGSSGVSSSSSVVLLKHNNSIDMMTPSNNSSTYSSSASPSPQECQSVLARKNSAPSQMHSGNDMDQMRLQHQQDAHNKHQKRLNKSLANQYTNKNNGTLTEGENEGEEEQRGDIDYNDAQSSDMSGDDIYTTPNDSVVSLQQNQLPGLAKSCMVKSHSTNNFRSSFNQHHSTQMASYANQARRVSMNQNGLEQSAIDEQQPTTNISTTNNTDHSNKLIKTNVNSRFFISSSSSEDSTAISSDLQRGQKINDEDLNNVMQSSNNHHHHYHQQQHNSNLKIPFSLGVHSHSISPPSSLIRRSPRCLVLKPIDVQHNQYPQAMTSFLPMANNNNFGSHVGATSPITSESHSVARNKNLSSYFDIQRRQPLFQMATFNKKSPSLYDFKQNSRRLEGQSSMNVNQQSIKDNFGSRSKMNTEKERLIGEDKLITNIKDNAKLFDSNNCQIDGFDFKTSNMNPRIQQHPTSNIPNSISLYDYKWSMEKQLDHNEKANCLDGFNTSQTDSEFKLAQMLINMGPDVNVKDADGCTALMYATLSDNFASIKCLVDNGANINETNNIGLNTLDLLCSKEPTESRLNTLKFFLSNGADRDAINVNDGSRLLDRLIRLHQDNEMNGRNQSNKLAYIDFLLLNGAKLGSSTWHAAHGKHEILLRLLRKLCQDGYFLYKNSSIEAAVYRFEYALKRVVELEYQLMSGLGVVSLSNSTEMIQQDCLQLKYQTYLGLSRCEMKRKFFKRALEFAQLAILIDSKAYEAYYSKALILKSSGDLDDALNTTNQSLKLIEKSIEEAEASVAKLKEQQEEAFVIFDANYDNFVQLREDSQLLKASKQELESMVEYLCEARHYISNLKDEIVEQQQQKNNDSCDNEHQSTIGHSLNNKENVTSL